jgi:Trypsin
MKFLLFALLAVAVYGQENYDGPEWALIDAASVVPIQEAPGFWKGREELRKLYESQVQVRNRNVACTIVTPNAHPYQASIISDFGGATNTVCSASILTTRSILTAAQCLVSAASTLVIAGAHNRNVVEPNQQRRTAGPNNYRRHPSFHPNTLNNDIAVVILPLPALSFNAFVNAVRRPAGAQLNENFVGELARHSGWGRTVATSTLGKGYSNVITNVACATIYPIGMVFAGVICIDNHPCQNEAGGVLTVPRSPGAPVQIGVTSFTSSLFPSGFARVTHYHDVSFSRYKLP